MFDADLQPRIEASHDLRQADKVASAATKPGRVAALAEAAAELQDAYARHGVALTGFGVEASQSVDAVQVLEAARLATCALYAFVRDRVSADIRTPDPAVPRTNNESATRALARDFKPSESELRNLSPDKIKETINAAAGGLRNDSAYAGVGQRASFADRLDAQSAVLETAKKRAELEAAEATQAQSGLGETRNALTRALTVYANQVESVLGAEERVGEIGSYVLAFDPAYRARRADKKPLAEEPDANNPGVDVIVPT